MRPIDSDPVQADQDRIIILSPTCKLKLGRIDQSGASGTGDGRPYKPTVEFKVMKMDPAEHCILAQGTVINDSGFIGFAVGYDPTNLQLPIM